MGAHPGGLFARDLPVDGYGEDYDFWIEARAATRSDDYDDWIRHWVLEPEDQPTIWPGSAPSGSRRCEPKPTRRCTRATAASRRPISMRRSTLGSTPRPTRPATSPSA